MGHIHSVYDTDTHFKIDATTRVVKNSPETKVMIVQHDHNSERFTFEIPRYVDGHDMSTCNVVQVHYINTDATGKGVYNKGIYEVEDLQISPDDDNVVICSWLISGNATQYVGKLSFIIRFACTTGEVVDYAWNTATHSNVHISSGINNGDEIVEEYVDILEQWREELFASGGVTDEQIAQAVEDYMEEHPVAPGTGGDVDLEGYATEQWVKDQKYLTAVPDGYAKTSEIPKRPEDIGALPNTYTPPNQTAEQVGADPKGTAASAVSQHNTADDSHNDIRLELKVINDRLTAFFDSDNQTLDELSEIVAYITSNKSLIDSITTSKVSVADIVNNLTSNVSNKPLSAAQGVVLKNLIDAVSNSLANYQPKGDYALRSEIPTVPTKVSAFTNDAGYLTKHQDISGKLDASALPTAINTALAQAKASGEFNGEDGKDGVTPVRGVDYWNPDDVAAIEADIATELAKRGQLKPEFANSIEECTDTTKLYVLPDDFIYAWMLTEVESGPAYTNLLPKATDTDGTTIYGGDYNSDGVNDGYATETRLSGSSGSASTAANAMMCASGFIPAKNGDIVRIKGTYPVASIAGYVISYNSSKAKISNQTIQQDSAGLSTALDAVSPTNLSWQKTSASWYTFEDGCVVIELTSSLFGDNIAYIRMNGHMTSDSIITVNEEIKEGGGTTIVEQWTSTGHAFVPADYEDRIVAVEKRTLRHASEIAELQKAVENGGTGDATETDALKRIKEWDKPVYDSAPVTLLADERTKPGLTASDRTVSAVYAKYRALMAKHPKYITERNLGKSTASATFAAVDILRFDFKEPDGLVESSRYTVNETKPKIILMSGVHNEYAGIYGLYYALEEIAENPEFDDIRRNAHIIVVPCSNPFGLTSQTAIEGWQMSHVNANGVAIHNNFGVEHNTYNADANVGEFNYGGTEPYSELETQYIDRVMAENTDAIAFVTCHNYNKDVVFGSLAIWASSATAHMCNLAYRLIDKISKAWHSKYGATLQNAIDTYKTDALPDGETRLGWAQYSTSAGTEQLNATKYGILATNLEISDNMRVFTDGQFSSDVMTRGAEVYANFFRTILWAYDHKDKKEYAPNLPWSE